MKTFDIAIGIDAPAERVWQVMIDIDRWNEWTPSVTSIKRLDSGPLVVGSRLVIRQPKFPPARWSITAFDPGLSFTWMSSGPGDTGRSPALCQADRRWEPGIVIA